MIVNCMAIQKTEEFARLLADTSRLKILELLLSEAKDVNQLSIEAKIKPTAVRHHLLTLMRYGFVEEERKTQRIGRPKIVYRYSKKLIEAIFPPRTYFLFSDQLIQGLKTILGEKQTGEILYQIGYKFGGAIISDISKKHDISKWTPENFTEFFIRGFLEEFEPNRVKIIKMTKNIVLYQSNNCVVYELAIKYPNLICECFDGGLLKGVADTMGEGVQLNKIKCMGHSDSICEYEAKWRK